MIKILSTALIVAMIGLFIQVYSTSRAQFEANVYRERCDSLQHVADSIYGARQPAQIELSRMQVAYDIFLETNPSAAEEYADIISDETE